MHDERPMIKSILVIINPISGYARSRELPLALWRRLRREGFDIHVHLTTGPGDAYAFTAAHVRQFDLALVAGGDGTVRDVVSAAAAAGVRTTILPTGTENVFAKEMGINADLDRIVRTVRDGTTIALDLGSINNRPFLMLSGVGFDAEVLLNLNAFRTGNITHLTYFWPIWRTFWEYAFHPVTVEADGEVVVEDCPALVFVSNIRRYAVGLRICDRADYQDGLLDVCIYRCDHQFPLLAHAWRTAWRRHLARNNVIYRQAKRITVTSAFPVPYQTDGDPAGRLPAEYAVLPGAVKLLVPNE